MDRVEFLRSDTGSSCESTRLVTRHDDRVLLMDAAQAADDAKKGFDLSGWTPVGTVLAALITGGIALFVGFIANARDKRDRERIKTERELLEKEDPKSPVHTALAFLVTTHSHEYVEREMLRRWRSSYRVSLVLLWIVWIFFAFLTVAALISHQNPGLPFFILVTAVPLIALAIRWQSQNFRKLTRQRLRGEVPWPHDPSVIEQPAAEAPTPAPAPEAPPAPDPAADQPEPASEPPAPALRPSE